MTSQPILAYKQSRRVQKGGSGCAAGILLLGGLLAVFTPFLWPLGFLLIGLAILCDAKMGKQHFCGSCGNDVADTSSLCPHCRAQLVRLPGFGFGRFLRILVITVGAVAGIIIIIMIIGRASRDRSINARIPSENPSAHSSR